MSSSSSSSSPAVNVPYLLEQLGCLLVDADDVLARLERRFRLIDVGKLSALGQEICSVVASLEKAAPDSLNGLRLVDDQSSAIDSENSSEDDEECDEEF